MSDDDRKQQQQLPNEIEVSVHTLPKPLLREFGHVFGEKYLTDDIASGGSAGDIATNDGMLANNTVAATAAAASSSSSSPDDAMEIDTNSTKEQLELIAIPTNQKARHDLVAVGDEIEQEKDRLLNVVSSMS